MTFFVRRLKVNQSHSNHFSTLAFYFKSGSSLENKNSFEKEGEYFFELKKMGGDEGTILKYKVKVREKNYLTINKSTLDI